MEKELNLPVNKSLIVVEDDPDDQYFLMSAFEEIGFAPFVHWLNSTTELLKCLHELRESGTGYPYTILLDYNMPVMNGEEILVKLKKDEDYKRIPLLIYSTGMNNGLMERLTALGADGCYFKANSAEEVIEFAKFLQQKIAAAVFRG
ncbi:MAG: response regulator [Bacteroidota bacterium]